MKSEKEKYFTKSKINVQANILLKEIGRAFKGRKISFDFKSSALLVLDMQKFFLAETSHAFIPSADAIIPNLKKLIGIYKKHNRPIIFTQHENTSSNSVLMYKLWKSILKKGTNSQITNELDTGNAIVIKKTQYDAFYKTQLEQILLKHSIKHILVSGVMTHLCCETIGRSAFIKGFMPFVPIDTTATYNKAFHKASLLNLSHGFASVDAISNIMGKLWNK